MHHDNDEVINQERKQKYTLNGRLKKEGTLKAVTLTLNGEKIDFLQSF